MSDATSNREMSSREIEDVLTSVRRLVAQESARPAPGKLLVLTPAHRVEAAPGIEPDAEPETGVEPGPEPRSEPAHETGSEITAGAEPGPGLGPELGLKNRSDTVPPGEAAPPADRPIAAEPAPQPANPQTAQQAAIPAAPAPDARARELARLQETLDELEIAAAGAPLRDRGANRPPPLFRRAAPERAPGPQGEDRTGEPAGDGAQRGGAATAEDGRPNDAGQGTQRLGQSVLGQNVPVAEPEEAELVPEGPRTEATPAPQAAAPPKEAVSHQMAADPDPAPEAEPESQPTPATGQAQEAADGIVETLIDEEMLRALVAQLVREQLRGQLGERITLQVRKLVRAEIARALDERQYL